MLPVVTKVIIGLIMSTCIFLIFKNLVNNNYRLFNLKTLFAILIVSIPALLFYSSEYNGITPILTFLIAIIVYKKLFNIRLSTSVLAMSVAMILTALADFIVIPIEIKFIDYESIKKVWYISIISNTIVLSIAVLISKIKILKTKFQKYCIKIDSNSLVSVIFFAIVSFWILIILFYNLSINLNSIPTYTLSSIIIGMLLVLYYLYVKECNNYNNLSQEYNMIFKYIQTFEDWIDNEQMYRHELKNNLSIIREMTNNKKIINKIDDMLKFSIILDENDIECLKNIPKGGLKGLLYYKLAISKNNKIKLTIEVSPKVTKIIKKLKDKDLKQTCIILGIYIDNAIEAALKSNKKNVTIEIYESKKQIVFVISNTYKDFIPINKMNFDGFTTKGEGHGRGLYYANKIISKSKKISSEKMFLDKYFVQKIYVKTD